MKNSKLFTTIAFAFMMLVSFNVDAQKFRPLDKSPMDAASIGRGTKQLAKVYYSRPQLKGRTVGTDLAPYGKVWRTGANEATQLILNVDMKLNGTTLKAGTYSIFTIPGEKEWEFIVSSDLNNWGSSGYKKDNTVASIKVPVTMGEESLEAFSMAFAPSDDGVHLHMGWDKVRVAVPFVK
ncbi:asparagine synthetase B [Winogradskyella sp. PC-19]|uniref:DUF2911 domain-containing protein n=1 Tax=unclassified Winogradskyella TaxID=2615021 RepID=UPI000B3C8F6F|nr:MULTISPECIES: DUF2911 domain-containing protein [unclassified Winogradskyella]ARV09123.1 asparagine synthetase B [Winogradskyella sp. PC-19]RZN83937.1 MAG: DUF2911 domain-containing protein [Winogradskyella sp.]